MYVITDKQGHVCYGASDLVRFEREVAEKNVDRVRTGRTFHTRKGLV